MRVTGGDQLSLGHRLGTLERTRHPVGIGPGGLEGPAPRGLPAVPGASTPAAQRPVSTPVRPRDFPTAPRSAAAGCPESPGLFPSGGSVASTLPLPLQALLQPGRLSHPPQRAPPWLEPLSSRRETGLLAPSRLTSSGEEGRRREEGAFRAQPPRGDRAGSVLTAPSRASRAVSVHGPARYLTRPRRSPCPAELGAWGPGARDLLGAPLQRGSAGEQARPRSTAVGRRVERAWAWARSAPWRALGPVGGSGPRTGDPGEALWQVVDGVKGTEGQALGVQNSGAWDPLWGGAPWGLIPRLGGVSPPVPPPWSTQLRDGPREHLFPQERAPARARQPAGSGVAAREVPQLLVCICVQRYGCCGKARPPRPRVLLGGSSAVPRPDGWGLLGAGAGLTQRPPGRGWRRKWARARGGPAGPGVDPWWGVSLMPHWPWQRVPAKRVHLALS